MIPTSTRGEAIGARLVSAIVERDWAELESCFDEGVQFRALIPPGVREARDRRLAAGHFERWFGDADKIELLTADITAMHDRVSISYRLRLHEDQWYLAEQRSYCDVSEGGITRMDLLCSGFRPEVL